MKVLQSRVRCKSCKVSHVVSGPLVTKIKCVGPGNIRLKYVQCPTCGADINLGRIK